MAPIKYPNGNAPPKALRYSQFIDGRVRNARGPAAEAAFAAAAAAAEAAADAAEEAKREGGGTGSVAPASKAPPPFEISK